MFFTKMMEDYIKKGLFNNYSKYHIIFPALEGKKIQIMKESNDYIVALKSTYDTFITNFGITMLYLKSIFSEKDIRTIISEYLSCGSDYSDEKFLFRYSNLLVVCGIYGFSKGIIQSDILSIEEQIIFRFTYEDGTIIQFYAASIYRNNSKEELKRTDILELEIGLSVNDTEKLRDILQRENINLVSSYIQQMVDGLSMVDELPMGKNIYNVCLLQFISNSTEDYNIFSAEGILLNRKTGFFVNDILHNEYRYSKRVSEGVHGAIVIKRNIPFLLFGNIRYLLNRESSIFAISELQSNDEKSKVKKMVFPFEGSNNLDNIICMYNVSSKETALKGKCFVLLMLENYEKRKSTVFTNREIFLLEGFISKQLTEYPQLLQSFCLDKDKALSCIYKEYENMYTIIQKKYPISHPFSHKNFMFDAMSFSLAYCMYVVPQYLGNLDMMNDFLNKKLLCIKGNRFDAKLFNENYSEFEIFFYLFVGIFCNSEHYKNLKSLEYEPDGNGSKRFEYAFVFKDYKINVEVKAIECAPEYSDNIDIIHMKDGTLFYKNYFHVYDDNEIIPEKVLINNIKLKTNYRQVSKNIRKIKEKCVEQKGIINLGFLMINYGTSREEYISYLMHKEQGYLNKNPLDKLDALILFSMCMDTDLLMEKILIENHVLVFPNVQKDNFSLLSDLRLDNYVLAEEDSPYACYFDETYSEYVGANSGGIVTIQRADATEEEWQRARDVIKSNDKNVKELVKLY